MHTARPFTAQPAVGDHGHVHGDVHVHEHVDDNGLASAAGAPAHDGSTSATVHGGAEVLGLSIEVR